MRKFCYILLALLLALSVLLVSCKDEADSIDSSESTSRESTQADTTKDTDENVTTSSDGQQSSESSEETTEEATFGESMDGGDEFENDNEAQYKDEWN